MKNPVNLTDLLTDPAYYLWKFEGPCALFAHMSRATFNKSVFTDQRLVASQPELIKVELEVLLKAFKEQKSTAPRLSFIFHVAHCGSTLLARALDLEKENLVCREPLVLRQLSLLLAENNWHINPPDWWFELLDLSLSLLGKNFINDAPVIIKANVPVNFAIDKLLSRLADSNGVLLYSCLENYLLSILKSADHRQWLANLTSSLGVLLEQQLAISKKERGTLSSAQNAACLWLAQISIFNEITGKYPNLRTLDSEAFFSDPATTLTACFQYFGKTPSSQTINSIISGELFSRHAKIPAYEYNNEKRLQDKKQLALSISSELLDAQKWISEKSKHLQVPGKLPSALCGQSPLLLGKHDAST